MVHVLGFCSLNRSMIVLARQYLSPVNPFFRADAIRAALRALQFLHANKIHRKPIMAMHVDPATNTLYTVSEVPPGPRSQFCIVKILIINLIVRRTDTPPCRPVLKFTRLTMTASCTAARSARWPSAAVYHCPMPRFAFRWRQFSCLLSHSSLSFLLLLLTNRTEGEL